MADTRDVYKRQGVSIVQTRVTCNVRTTIKSATQYLLQMKRWLLFSSIYLKKHLDFKVFTPVSYTHLVEFIICSKEKGNSVAKKVPLGQHLC